MNIKKVFAIVASSALIFASVTPAFADSLTITGNGADTNNTENVSVTQTTSVSQSNSANISNNVSSSSNSGNNNANDNTGGDTTISTGNAKTNVSVTNDANSNVANVSNCGCSTGDLGVSVTDNGTGSKNTANTTDSNETTLTQANEANISNDVHKADSNSGENHANDNTGGSVTESTGNATTDVTLSTNANQNVAQVGSGSTDGSDGSSDSVIITGNGADTQNKVNLGLTDWVVLGQANDADVNNSVNAKSSTGENSANDNTGGNQGNAWGDDVTVSTGNATTNVGADTAVNFNDASVGCDCLMDVTAKIAGNGASTGDNKWDKTDDVINAELTNGQEIGQANGGEGINNDLNGNSKSGDNNSSSNTGATSDPSVTTGDSWSGTQINNQGNANVFGGSTDSFPFPWNGSNTNVTVTFNLQDLLSALGL